MPESQSRRNATMACASLSTMAAKATVTHQLKTGATGHFEKRRRIWETRKSPEPELAKQSENDLQTGA